MTGRYPGVGVAPTGLTGQFGTLQHAGSLGSGIRVHSGATFLNVAHLETAIQQFKYLETAIQPFKYLKQQSL